MDVAVLISGWARRDRPVAKRFFARVRLFPALGLWLASTAWSGLRGWRLPRQAPFDLLAARLPVLADAM